MLPTILLHAALASELPLPDMEPGIGAAVDLHGARGTWRAAQWTGWMSLGTVSAGGLMVIGGALGQSCCVLEAAGAFVMMGGGVGLVVSAPLAAGSAARGAHLVTEAGAPARSGLATGAVVATVVGAGSLVGFPIISIATEGYMSTESLVGGSAMAVAGVGTAWALSGTWWGYTDRGFHSRLVVAPGAVYVSGEF